MIKKIEVTGGGYVALIETMGSDSGVAQGARMSYDNADKEYSLDDDQGLINFLVEHFHTSPLELAEMHFEISAPMAVFNHFVRHRTANINCMSARYVELPDDKFNEMEDEDWRGQGKGNKQVGDGQLEPHLQRGAQKIYDTAISNVTGAYKAMRDLGVTREQARFVMPESRMTKFRYKMDLNNLIKFIGLRTEWDAQKETRDYAFAIRQHMFDRFPMIYSAAEEYVWGATKLSVTETRILKEIIDEYVFVLSDEDGMSHFEDIVKDYLPEFGGKKRRLRDFIRKLS